MKRGFTLIELSIVLIIIGLLVGGILVGQDLIRAAQLNSVVSDVNQYKTSLNAFQLKYDALPGDMITATDFWPGQTDDGDDDGRIGGLWNDAEDLTAWEQLALAGLVVGTFSGEFDTTNSRQNRMVDVNVPGSGINGAGYTIRYNDAGYAGATSLSRNANYIRFAAEGVNDGSGRISMNRGALLALEAQSIDQKMDDGVAATGRVESVDQVGTGSGYHDSCTSGGAYGISGDTLECTLFFWLD